MRYGISFRPCDTNEDYAFDAKGNSIPPKESPKKTIDKLQPLIDLGMELVDAAVLYDICERNIENAVTVVMVANLTDNNPLEMLRNEDLFAEALDCLRSKVKPYRTK